MPTKTPRTLPIELKQKYGNVWWLQFWNHNELTPVHLWKHDAEFCEGYSQAERKVLCGKVIDPGSMHRVDPEESGHLCRSCIRIALKRQ